MIPFAGIIDSDGQKITDSKSCCDILGKHWEQVHRIIPPSIPDMDHFRNYIQRVLPHIEWVLPIEAMNALLDKFKDSAAGPDGLCYSSWANSGNLPRQILYQCYRDLLRGVEPPPSFNSCLMVFIPKGTESSDSEAAFRAAADTRPISLSNASNKIISALLARPLSLAARNSVHAAQRAFIPGRMMCDNVYDLETNLLINASLRGISTTGLVLFDLKAAFPSLHHHWIWFVLELMQVPKEQTVSLFLRKL